MTPITSELARLSGPVAYLLVAALVFGETAIFLGFVIPGETAVVLGAVVCWLIRRHRRERVSAHSDA